MQTLDQRTKRTYYRIALTCVVSGFCIGGIAWFMPPRIGNWVSLIAFLFVCIGLAFRIAGRADVRIWK